MATKFETYPPKKPRPLQKIAGHEMRAGAYDILLMLFRIAAAHDDAPQRCRNRECRGKTRCMAGFRTPDRPACDVPLTRAGESTLNALLDFVMMLNPDHRGL
ncbi:hypothetical protein GA830_01835 [Mesorhizobium sp. NBSH29]|uniref:hypothetical protein n=1 Tax=Mesorhizobium sp. NBSH29 TaxID=2654249 RepID=UPI00189696E8|nr:hypothetical protein [Mesorhizobium sp. NBSH29]QPC85612.1 hypothetical protein GA830_01835 [Mesorhizobium sp. NBSH29]